jgi:hypothetical protein
MHGPSSVQVTVDRYEHLIPGLDEAGTDGLAGIPRGAVRPSHDAQSHHHLNFDDRRTRADADRARHPV